MLSNKMRPVHRKSKGSDGNSQVTIHPKRIAFSAGMCDKANLSTNNYVALMYNDNVREIAFIFREEAEKTENDYKVTLSKSKKAASCSCQEIFNKPWYKSIFTSDSKKTYIAKLEESGKWVIGLAPTFENKYSADSTELIPENTFGVYRYLSTNAQDGTTEIIYMGVGNIHEGLADAKKRNWAFDKIEYSIFNFDEEDEAYWRNYLVEFLKDKHHLDVPIYNQTEVNTPKE